MSSVVSNVSLCHVFFCPLLASSWPTNLPHPKTLASYGQFYSPRRYTTPSSITATYSFTLYTTFLCTASLFINVHLSCHRRHYINIQHCYHHRIFHRLVSRCRLYFDLPLFSFRCCHHFKSTSTVTIASTFRRHQHFKSTSTIVATTLLSPSRHRVF